MLVNLVLLAFLDNLTLLIQGPILSLVFGHFLATVCISLNFGSTLESHSLTLI